MRVLGHGIVLKEVLLFIARLTFESGRNPVVCVTIQMKPLLVEFSHGAIYFSSNFVVLTFESEWNPMVWPFKWYLFSSIFTWYYIDIYVFLTFQSVDEIYRVVILIMCLLSRRACTLAVLSVNCLLPHFPQFKSKIFLQFLLLLACSWQSYWNEI